MWLWLISSIAASIFGGAVGSWFADTRLGEWFYRTVDNIASWAAYKINIKILKNEEKWKHKYPNIAKRFDIQERRLIELEMKAKKRR